MKRLFVESDVGAVKTEDEVTVLLKRARAIIEKGWIQGSYVNDRGHCAIGAIYHAAGWNGGQLALWTYPMTEEAKGRLLKLLPEFTSVARWNDAALRTKAEVLALFDRAINTP